MGHRLNTCRACAAALTQERNPELGFHKPARGGQGETVIAKVVPVYVEGRCVCGQALGGEGALPLSLGLEEDIGSTHLILVSRHVASGSPPTFCNSGLPGLVGTGMPVFSGGICALKGSPEELGACDSCLGMKICKRETCPIAETLPVYRNRSTA